MKIPLESCGSFQKCRGW